MMDAVRQNAATVYPAGVTGPMDYFADSSAFAPDAGTAAYIVRKLLADSALRKANVVEMTERIRTTMNSSVFKGRLLDSFGSVEGHCLHDFHAVAEPDDSPLSAFIYAMTVRRKTKFSIPGLAISSVREGTSKYHEFSLFGGRFVWRF